MKYRIIALSSLLLLTSCVTTYVGPFFDGTVNGRYSYKATVDGVPATVTSKVTLEAKATLQGESAYNFMGTMIFLEERYTVTGTETYPSNIRNLDSQVGVEADVLEGETPIHKLCGENDYEGYVNMVMYAPSSVCSSPGDKLGVVTFSSYFE